MSRLVEQFKKINDFQEQLMQLCDEKNTYISQKKTQEVNGILKKELLVLHDLEQALIGLKEAISTACRQCGIPEGKLDSLFPHLQVEETEQLMACQRCAIHYEKIIKNKLKNAERQVEMEMALPEIIHRTRLQHLQENGVQTTMYNRKY